MEMSQGYQSPQNTLLIRSADGPDIVISIKVLCPVCGDNASGYSYGIRTCGSCKAFFRTTVHNKKVYTCSADRSCHIDKTRRTWCRYCRFQKCLDHGMKIEAVGHRKKFGVTYNRDQARKLRMMRQRQIAVQTLSGDSLGDGVIPFGYQTPNHFGNIHKIKQEIQIPQVSSLTSSPGSTPIIREYVSMLDDEWRNSVFSLLQSQNNNHSEVDLFDLMCKVLEQNLLLQITWVRSSVFLKGLELADQVKLLEHSWSDMIVLDHLHQRIHNNLPDETKLSNGQKFCLLCLGLLGDPTLAYHFGYLTQKLMDLKFDVGDYVCVKFLLLLNPGNDMRGISNRKLVQDGHEQVLRAHLDHCLTVYPHIQDKFTKLQQVMPEIHQLASRGEDHLYHKQCSRGAPTETPLMQMLHSKRK